MKFKALDRDGNVKMSTEHRNCIYPHDTLVQMAAVGYSFRLNGKRWKPGQDIFEDAPKPARRKTRIRKETTKPC